MEDATLKSFADLHEDYAFFERHASETAASLDAWLPLLPLRRPLRALDFGAGSGSYGEQLWQRAQIPPEQLQLTLVEPDSGFRRQALERLEGCSAHPLQAIPLLDRELGPAFDLIFSHHVLYYVPDLETTLRRLHSALAPGATMLLAQGGAGNGLNQIVQTAFAGLNRRPPYHYSEDTAATLRHLDIPYRTIPVESEVEFPDSRTGRLHMLRFLLSQHLSEIGEETALALFEPFRRGSRILIPSRDELFQVQA